MESQPLAAVGSLEGHVLRAGGVEDHVVPRVGKFTLADGLGVVHCVGLFDGQVEGDRWKSLPKQKPKTLK